MYTPTEKKKVTVIIPFYRPEITFYEAIALNQCFKVLRGHDIIAVKPAGLTLPVDTKQYKFKKVVSFDDAFFADVKGYNCLMLSDKFYKEFLDYEFMLIHQLDAFVFEDRLAYWCAQCYDYIGAPWLRDGVEISPVSKALLKLKYYFHTRFNIERNNEPTKYQYENKVGNGGFSLRRTMKFYEVCRQKSNQINSYIAKSGHHFNEDRFWSVEVNRKIPRLKIPGYKKAIGFSFELLPQKALALNQQQLPFGCHAWDKYPAFWKPIFELHGYDI